MKAVICDFDYTLIDSSCAIVHGFQGAMRELGLKAVPITEIKKTIGLPLEEGLRRLAGVDDKGVQEEFVTHFNRLADEAFKNQTRLLPGTSRFLSDMSRAGYTLAVVSTKFRYQIAIILEAHGLSHYFSVILGGTDVARQKPDPEGLVKCLQKLGVQASDSVYVGDHLIDLEAANRANVAFVGVLSTPFHKFTNVFSSG